MSSNAVRSVILRVMFDLDYHDLLATDPGKALREYDLTDREKSALTKPTEELWSLIGQTPDAGPPQVVNVSFHALKQPLGSAGEEVAREDIERLRPLINAIRSSAGAERSEFVRTLVNELTKGA